MMICSNCGELIRKNQIYFRFMNKGSTLCSEACVHNSYKGFYSNNDIKKGIQEFKRYK